MKILFSQKSPDILLESLGVYNCYVKHLSGETDAGITTHKKHHHTGFEIHIMYNGHQVYCIDDNTYNVEESKMLIIPPMTKHLVQDNLSFSSKISITFTTHSDGLFQNIKNAVLTNYDKRIDHNIRRIFEESKTNLSLSEQLSSSNVFEIFVLLLRGTGFKEHPATPHNISGDERILMAKEYIKDNIEFNITVSDVASYCHLGTKQLTRLFKSSENTTPLAYIQKVKANHIESLLTKGLSLKNISEKMNFSSEYHMNSFFKKYAGLPPGEFRKMIK